jgi:pimeloyl-ACP methyl ester carboxylesterase
MLNRHPVGTTILAAVAGLARTGRGIGHVAAALLAAALVMACDSGDLVAPDPAAGLGPAVEVNRDHDLVLEDLEFRPGVTADVHVRMFVNEGFPCRGRSRTALVVHGVNHTAATWGELAEAFFRGGRDQQLCRVAALDLPGHGESGVPDPSILPFGEMLVEDNVGTVRGALDRLADQGFRPRIVMGHSQGTLTLQLLQETLRREGTTLADRYGVTDAVFFGTQGPREAPNGLPPNVDDLIASLVITTPERGTFVSTSPGLFQELWFSNPVGELSSRAPSLETIEAEGFDSPGPLFGILQTVGSGGFQRPSVSSGVFAPASGTRLQVVNFADDPFSPTPDAGRIYEHLTNDASRSGFVSLADPRNEAVHDYTITHPDRVRAAVAVP